MIFDFPAPPESTSDIDVIDLDVRRQNRSLTTRVERLETELAEARAQVRPALEEGRSEHGISCTYHQSVLVDDKAGAVTCRFCGTRLDPLLVLMEFARKERNFAYNVNFLREEQKSLREEVEQLKKTRASLRSQIKAKLKKMDAAK